MMPSRRTILAAAMTLAVSGCATLPPVRFSPEEIAGWKYTGTRVSFRPDANVRWPGRDTAFAETKGIQQLASIANPAGGQSGQSDAGLEYSQRVEKLITTEPTRSEYLRFLQVAAVGPIANAMGNELSGRMIGNREVRVEISIRQMAVWNSAVRILVNFTPVLQANVKIIDNKTNEVLAEYPELTTVVPRQGGVVAFVVETALQRDDFNDLTTRHAIDVRNWLFKTLI